MDPADARFYRGAEASKDKLAEEEGIDLSSDAQLELDEVMFLLLGCRSVMSENVAVPSCSSHLVLSNRFSDAGWPQVGDARHTPSRWAMLAMNDG